MKSGSVTVLLYLVRIHKDPWMFFPETVSIKKAFSVILFFLKAMALF